MKAQSKSHILYNERLLCKYEGIEAPAGDAFRGSNLEPLPSLSLSPGSQDHSDSPGVAPPTSKSLQCKWMTNIVVH